MGSEAFEIWEDPTGHARFYFSHIGSDFATGTLVLVSDSELPRHHRPLAFENLVQVGGVSQLTLTDADGNVQETFELRPGTSIKMKKDQWHIHANPYEEESITLFKAVGDVTAVIADMRRTFTRIDPTAAPEE